jgi:DNA-binding MarR family transcriptional regulator
MSPGTRSTSHAARNASTTGEADGDSESSTLAVAAAVDAGDATGERATNDLSAPIGALERIVIGAVGITTQALAQAAPDVELTFSQWRALLILGDPPSGRRVGEVAARVGVTLPATSRLLRRLDRRGLVALAPDEADRRATRATLTGQGAGVRDAILAFRRAALRDVAEHATAAGRGIAGPEIDSLAASFERYA